MEQKPSIGRMVHYVNLGDKDGKYPPEIQAAVITGVYTEKPTVPVEVMNPVTQFVTANTVDAKPDSMYVDLKVFYRTGLFDTQKVPFSAKYERGHWSWPPRV